MVQSGTYNFGGVYEGSATLNVAGTLSTAAGTDSAFDMSVTAGSWENAGKVTANDGFHVTGDASVTGGSVTASSDGMKVDGHYTQTGGDVRTSSLTVGGTTTISGGSIGSAGSTPLALEGVFIGGAAVDNVALTDSTITGQLDTAGALQVGGKMTVNKAGFTQGVDLWDATTYSDGLSGYATAAYEVQLVKTPGNVSALADGVTWQDNSGVQATYDDASGKLIVKADTEGTLYYVNVNGDIIYDKDEAQFGKATGIVMNGGKLHLRTPLSDLIANNAGIRVECPEKNNLLGILANAVLNEEDLTVSGTAGVKLSGDGEYVLDAADLELGTGVSLAQDWSGTVFAPEQNLGSTADLTVGQHLFNQNQVDPHNSTVKIAGITARNLTALPGRHGLMLVEGDMALSGAASSVNGDLEVTGTATLAGAGAALNVGEDMDVQALVLGNTQEKAVLTVTGTLNARSITLAHADSAITAGELGLPVNLLMTPEVLNSIGVKASQAPVTMVELTGDTASATMVSVNGKDISGGIGEPGSKYFFTIAWNAKLLQAVGTRNPNYVVEKLEPTDSNAAAGATLLSDAFAASDPQVNAPDSDLAAILNAVDAGFVTNEQAAAVAGSSTTALGMAFAGDVERQLRAIRNRTTTMGVDPCVFHEEMPYFNAWINAEGNMAELDQDGNMPGYTLDSWGGTVGFDVDVNPRLTLGMAVTAMYGDLTTDGPDTLEGDMDTYYVSAFARYSKRGWSHTFIATVGKMDTAYERTVNHAGGSYMAEGDTDGTAFGLMYEVARSYTLDYEGNVGGQLVANVAYRHTTVGSYEETGRDAALKVDDQTLDTITFGVGGRMQAVVGENLFNRTSVFEARALAKFDVGDRSSEADVAFLGGSRSATVESAELGAFGVELGAGFSIPVGNVNDGTIFFDVSAELRSGYTNVNGTVGYRINF
ncbi:MAG: autotransporter outer membrane beta-barrel domain-containing protein, partial [Akkermansia sp.]|nr:autotransporter outer membrane beta-barrel domain-containing protein [Akkermansia sp.]